MSPEGNQYVPSSAPHFVETTLKKFVNLDRVETFELTEVSVGIDASGKMYRRYPEENEVSEKGPQLEIRFSGSGEDRNSNDIFLYGDEATEVYNRLSYFSIWWALNA